MNRLRDNIADYFPVYIITAFIIVLVTVGIGLFIGHENGIHSGSVTAKADHAAYTSMVCVGKPIICYPQYHPETWSVTISNGKQSNSFDIPHAQWSKINDGDNISFNGDTLVAG